MKQIKEFRIDQESYPFLSAHLIIRQNGNVEVIKGSNVKHTKIGKKVRFFKELDDALVLDFKMMNHYVQTENYYHISIIYDDDTEESHFYIDNLARNNQLSIRNVLMTYLDKEFQISAVTEED